MKKYIVSSRKDDLIKEKQQWQMKYDARKQLYRDQERKYDEARWAWNDNIVALIKKEFSSYIDKLPYLEIFADYGWKRVEIRFKYADYLSADEREDVCLRWSYEIRLNENGELKRESNSWSGFDATTSAQLDDLMNSANFLKAIVDYDWAPLLKEAKESYPDYNKYIGIKDPSYDPDYKDPGYDKMIREAELEEAVGKDIWIQGDNGKTWYKIVSETPKFYNIAKINTWDMRSSPEYAIQRIQRQSPWRVKKDNVNFDRPITTISQEDLIARITG